MKKIEYLKKNTNNKFSVSLLVVRSNIKISNSQTKMNFGKTRSKVENKIHCKHEVTAAWRVDTSKLYSLNRFSCLSLGSGDRES